MYTLAYLLIHSCITSTSKQETISLYNMSLQSFLSCTSKRDKKLDHRLMILGCMCHFYYFAFLCHYLTCFGAILAMPTRYFLLCCSDMLSFQFTWFRVLVTCFFLPNLHLQIKAAIKSAEHSVKEFIFGPDKRIQGSEREGGKPISNSAEKHP